MQLGAKYTPKIQKAFSDDLSPMKGIHECQMGNRHAPILCTPLDTHKFKFQMLTTQARGASIESNRSFVIGRQDRPHLKRNRTDDIKKIVQEALGKAKQKMDTKSYKLFWSKGFAKK